MVLRLRSDNVMISASMTMGAVVPPPDEGVSPGRGVGCPADLIVT